jgi:hypothetical protein
VSVVTLNVQLHDFYGGTEGNHVNGQSGVAGRGTDTRDLPHIK